MTNVLINGQATDYVSFDDRGLNYGDGVFETIAVDQHGLQYWQAHIRRLNTSAQRLELPLIDEAVWLEDIRRLIKTPEPCIVKLVLTRGRGGRGYRYDPGMTATRIVSVHPRPSIIDRYPQGIAVRLCEHRLYLNPVLAGMKHLNRLDQVIARNEWSDEQIVEGLMMDQYNRVLEGTATNLFAVNQGEMHTAASADVAVDGIIRQVVIELAEKNGITVAQQALSQEDLLHMDEIFITNSIWGICPVTTIGKHTFHVGDKTRRLQQLFNSDREQQIYAL